MAIQRKLKTEEKEAAAQAFIGGDNPQIPTKPKARAIKKPVALRFDPEQLIRIDAAAAANGVSRNAWIAIQCAKGLKDE